MVRFCCVPGCSARDDKKDGHSFFKFPLDGFQHWVKAIGNPSLEGKTYPELRNRRVCECHFEDWCFTNIGAAELKRRLITSAVPTVGVAVTRPEPVVMDTALEELIHNIETGNTVEVSTTAADLEAITGISSSGEEILEICGRPPEPVLDAAKSVAETNKGGNEPRSIKPTGPLATTVNIVQNNLVNPSIMKAADINSMRPTIPKMSNPILENIQNKNVLATRGVNENMSLENIAPLEEFLGGVPTILDVFSYSPEKWKSTGNLEKFNPEPIVICCQGKCKPCLTENQKMTAKLMRTQRQNKNLRLVIKNLKKENRKLSRNNLDFLNEMQRRLVDGMFRRTQVKSRGFRYDPLLLNDSLALRRISRAAYLFVRRKFHLPIPSEHSLRVYVSKMNQMTASEDPVSDADGQTELEVDIDGTVVPEEMDCVGAIEIVSSNVADGDEENLARNGKTVTHTGNTLDRVEVNRPTVKPAKVVSSNVGRKKQIPVKLGKILAPVEENRTTIRPAEVVSSNVAGNDHNTLEPVGVDTGTVGAAEVSSTNAPGNSQIPPKAATDQTSNLLPPMELDNVRAVEIVSSSVGNDGQNLVGQAFDSSAPLTGDVERSSEVFVDRTYNALAPMEVDRPTAEHVDAGGGQKLIEVSINENYSLYLPVQTVEVVSSEYG